MTATIDAGPRALVSHVLTGTPAVRGRYLARPGGDELQPSPARVLEALLGEPHPYDIDQWVADKVRAAVAGADVLASAPYESALRALRHLATTAAPAQYLLADLMVAPAWWEPLHAVINRYRPGTSVLYVGCDPVTLARARAWLSDLPHQVDVAAGDVLAPHTLTGLDGDDGVVLDFAEPVVVQLGTAISHCDDDTAAAVLADYAALLAPSSVLVLSAYTAPTGAAAARRVREALEFAFGETRFRPIHELDQLLPATVTPIPSGPHPAPAGFVPCDQWWPDGPQLRPGPPSQATGMVATVAVTIR
ncbi:SAM-dependent methyltransferase [Amycolatopsis sp. NPDC059021]|uniref:SAM-dependent methyltransferase n=1 Tax=Amycolatopsis sp. NPDC059021 TaxID=3346704 RepID=UPI00366FE448